MNLKNWRFLAILALALSLLAAACGGDDDGEHRNHRSAQ